MPSCIQDDGLRNIWHKLSCTLDTHDVSRHVQWSKWNEGLQLLDDFICNESGFLEHLATMENSMAYSSDFAEVLDTAVGWILKHLKDVVDGFRMGWRGELVVELFLSPRLLFNGRILLADAFYHTDCKDILVVPIVYLVFCG